MPVNRTMQQLVTKEPADLGSTPWFRYAAERLRLFAQFSATEFGRGATANLAEEVDPFAVLALLPSMLDGIFVITDASAHRLIAVEKCNFLSSIPVNAEIGMTARLIAGQFNADGHLVYQVGFLVNVKGESRPSIIGELVGMAGNPAK